MSQPNVGAEQEGRENSKCDKILLVDDEVNVLKSFQRPLSSNFAISTATSGVSALNKLQEEGPFAVVVSDQEMPQMSGIEFLHKVQEQYPETVCLMLTGNQDQKTAVTAMNELNIFRFLNKPISIDEVSKALQESLSEYEVVTVRNELVKNTLSGCVKVLTEVMAVLDPIVYGNNIKVRRLLIQFAPLFEIKNLSTLILANMLSEIGFVSVPSPYLIKYHSRAELSPEERKIFSRVPSVSARLLNHIPRMEEVTRVILYLNKNFDGTGPPDELCRGEDIPFGARLLRVLKDLQLLLSEGVSEEEALSRLKERIGWYDPKILTAIAEGFQGKESAITEVREVREEEPELVKVKSEDLQIGHRVLSNLETCDGVVLLAAGDVITPVFLERIKNYSEFVGIKEPIYVDCLEPEEPDHEE